MIDSTDTARLLITCDDQPGIVAAVAGLMARVGANIISLDQHSTDAEGGKFFQRTVFHIEGFADRRAEIEHLVEELAADFGMEWSLHDASQRKRVAIFVSQYDHCLLDLLWRVQRGDLDIDITCVVSNHTALEQSVANFGVPFVHIPSSDKAAMEAQQLELLAGNARALDVAKGDWFFRQGEPGESLFVLESGQVELCRATPAGFITLGTLGPGDCFGEMSIIDYAPRSASVRALQDCHALELPIARLHSLYEQDLEQFALIQMNLARELSRRLRATTERLVRTGNVPLF